MKLFNKIKKFFTPTKWYKVHSEKCRMYKSIAFGLNIQIIDGVAVFIVNEEETKIRAYITDGDIKQFLDPSVLIKQISNPTALNEYLDLIDWSE